MSRSRALRATTLAAAALCLTAAAALAGRALWATSKASLAQHLLERAWRGALASPDGADGPARPWPWADVVAAARLEVPAHGVSLVVLGDASGEALAFGPGLAAGDPSRADRAPVALGGHRDTHLAFLERVGPGTELRLQAPDGAVHAYRAGAGRVVDVRRETLALDPDAPGLVLVTCWPFDAPRAGGPLRWVVGAEWESVTKRRTARRDASAGTAAVIASAGAP